MAGTEPFQCLLAAIDHYYSELLLAYYIIRNGQVSTEQIQTPFPMKKTKKERDPKINSHVATMMLDDLDNICIHSASISCSDKQMQHHSNF